MFHSYVVAVPEVAGKVIFAKRRDRVYCYLRLVATTMLTSSTTSLKEYLLANCSMPQIARVCSLMSSS